ncbi:MAG: hypothetical protein IKS72_00365 [Prevotella sp.]|nr:hypothetical protein [Prevotella sp.]
MNKQFIENLLLSELAEVKGGKASNACFCESGAGETVIVVPSPEEPGKEVYT